MGSLDQYKSEQTKLLEQKKAQQRETANINHQKLMKYLDQTSFGQSKGMSESGKIKAANALTQNLAAADLDYYAGKAALDKEVADAEKQEQDALYNEIMTTIDSGSWNTTAELENYINSTSEGLSDTQKAQVQQRLDYYKNNPDQQEKNDEYYKTHNEDGSRKDPQINIKEVPASGYLVNMVSGNDFKIDGNKVELGELVVEQGIGEGKTSQVLPADVLEKTSDGQIFEYNGKLYYRSKFKSTNGNDIDRIFEVRGRSNTNSEEYLKALALFTGKQTEQE